MRPLDRKLLRDLRRMWPQAGATSLVIGCGVAVFLMMMGAMASLRATRDAYYETSRFADVFAHAERVPAHVADRLAAIEGVAAVETRIVRLATVELAGFDELVTARLVSIPDEGSERLNRLTLRAGRRPVADGTIEALVNGPFAEAHGLRPGDRLEVVMGGRLRTVRVTGIALSPEFVYALPPGALLPDDRRFAVLWLPRKVLAAAYDRDGAFDDVLLKLRPGADRQRVIAEVDRLLEAYGGLGAYAREDQVSAFFVDNEITQLGNFSAILPTIFLAVGIFLLDLGTRRLVESEREIIGTLGAFGYPRATIARHYALFALAIALSGLVLGLALGTWLAGSITGIYRDYFRFPLLELRFDPGVYLLAAALTLLAGLTGALRAVRDVLRLQPAEAMRPPAPPAYRRRTGMARALARRLDQPTLMILRHIARFPLRAAAAVLGTAAALALLLTALQWTDAVDFLIETEFHDLRRQDLTVSFDRDIDAAAVAALRALPGVLAVEPVRVVPVELLHGPRRERTSVTALPEDGLLQIVRDVDGRPLTPDSEGILVARSFAERLGLQRGRTVLLHGLAGRRHTVEARIVGIFETWLGEPIYAGARLAERLTGEAFRIDQVALRVDPAHLAELRRRLAGLPRVAAVEEKAARIRSFRETMAESIEIVTGFYIAFAAALAFGVVYNAGRITLGERARELASLRVLGFTAAEAAYVLVGELLLLAVLALPPGILGGIALVHAIAAGFETELFRLPAVIRPVTVAATAAVVLVAAVATALLVGRRVFALDLVAALKARE